MDAADLIRRFSMLPHPEGGYYSETYRDAARVRRADGAERSASTAIYYLLCDGAYSGWHRIRSDETWHFYAGQPLLVHVLDAGGEWITHRLGNPLEYENVAPQATVPAGCWFAAELADPRGFAFVGCTVAPGFEFSEFEIADEAALLAGFPQHAERLKRLLRA